MFADHLEHSPAKLVPGKLVEIPLIGFICTPPYFDLGPCPFLQAALDKFAAAGIKVGEVHYISAGGKASGVDPQRNAYRSFASFRAIQTATAGCSRKSPIVFRGASIPACLRSHPQRIWRARFIVFFTSLS